MLLRQKRRDLAVRQDRRHHLPRHLRRQQPVAVLGEHRCDPHRVVDAQCNEPAEQQVIIHLLHQLPLGPHRVEDLQQARPDQPLGRDRGPAMGGVEACELAIQARQRVVHHPSDSAQRMTRRDALLQVDTAEQRPRRPIRPAHPSPRRHHGESESRPRNRLEGGIFQQPVNVRSSPWAGL